MDDLDVSELTLQVLSGETSVTVSRLMFTAQEARVYELVPCDLLIEASRFEQAEILLLIIVPTSLLLLIFVKHRLSWCHLTSVSIIDARNGSQKVLQILRL